MLGGESAERAVSLKSGAAVLAALKRAGVDAHAFDPAEKPLAALKDEGYARVFIALHGRGGEDGTLQGALELMKLPYTGSGVLASALAMDKWRTKLAWRAAGVPGAGLRRPQGRLRFRRHRASSSACRCSSSRPREGSSVGISKVKQAGDLRAAWELAAKYDKLVLAERFVDAGEYTVGILAGQALPVMRIVPATEFYDYEAKYDRDDTQYRIPSGLTRGAGKRDAGAGAARLRCARRPRLGSRRPHARP